MAGGAGGPGRGKNGGPQQTAGGVLIDRVQKLSPEEEAAARIEAEVAAGLRCGGCGVRVSSGFEFVVIDVGRVSGRTFGNYRNMVACTGVDGCDFAGQAIDHAVAMRTIKQRFIDTPEMRARIEGILQRAKVGEDGDGD